MCYSAILAILQIGTLLLGADEVIATALAPPGATPGPLRVYRLSPSTLPELVYEVTSNPRFTYRIWLPQVSASGSIVSFTREDNCIGGRNGCPSVAPTITFRGTIIRRSGRPDQVLAGSASLSRNGRYAVTSDTRFFGGSSSPAVHDLESQVAGPDIEPASLDRGCRMVSNTGTAVLGAPHGITVASVTSVRRIALPGPALGLVISDDGLTAIASTSSALLRVNVSTGALTVLRSTAGPVERLCATGDLGRLVWVEAGRARLLENGVVRTLWDGEVESVGISDDGRLATYTKSGRIWNHDLAAGTPPRLIAVLSEPPRALDAPSPGSIFRIEAAGLAAGSRAMLGQTSLPILNAGPGFLMTQIPWETTSGTYDLAITHAAAGATVFGAEAPKFTVRDFDPRFIRSRGEAAIAIHPLFDHLVTAENPARPGQFIHVYMTGLGPVTTTVATGQPSPAAPPAATKSDLMCGFSGSFFGRRPPLWSGLAPGLIGLYQVSIEVPHDLTGPARPVPIFCGAESGGANATVIVGSPVP